MPSESTKKFSTDSSPDEKAVNGSEKSLAEGQSQLGALLLRSRSDGPSGQDINNLDPATKTLLGPGASPADGPRNALQMMEEIKRATTGSASGMDMDAHDGGRAAKTAEPTMCTKETRIPLDGDLNQDEEGLDSSASPTLATLKPTLENSWKAVMKEIGGIDNAQYASWDDDINTLLVFAGLFSAVVTAFTIESYQWLSEDPQDTTVAILMQISQQMQNLNGTTKPISFEPFKASPSNVRINTFWFLSLITSLIDALFGLLCKQWLREHRHPTHTRTPQEALALLWLRRESLEKWHVPAFVATLPMLLELSLFLFFAGLLELLWSLHPIPFSIAMVVVGIAALFYIGTTILPGINIIRQALQVNPRAKMSPSFPVKLISTLPPIEFICPYKSPQAWITFTAARALFHTAYTITGRVVSFLRPNILDSPRFESWHYHVYYPFRDAWFTSNDTLNNLTSWPLVDLEIIQRSSVKLVPPFYELKAFQWLVQELQDTPSMIPHLENTLGTIPPHLVMPVVFKNWLFSSEHDRDWTEADVGSALRNELVAGSTLDQRRWFRDAYESTTFYRLLHYHHIVTNSEKFVEGEWEDLLMEWEKLWTHLKLSPSGTRVGPPFSFHTLNRILKDPGLDHQSFGPWLSRFCTETSYKHWYHPLPINHLAQHIIATSTSYHQAYTSCKDRALFGRRVYCIM
ncbi:hypothetical protein V5O48_018364 [Marasmius crinis-equi]|uniref:DUF6535 domain-containing protein n=1 Tax=Marasmius crinis-equi TaxID=585013 RepID=A0ABR3ELI5_9AGAR